MGREVMGREVMVRSCGRCECAPTGMYYFTP